MLTKNCFMPDPILPGKTGPYKPCDVNFSLIFLLIKKRGTDRHNI